MAKDSARRGCDSILLNIGVSTLIPGDTHLDDVDALDLFLRCAELENPSEAIKQEAKLIVQQLDHSSLAITLAGSYICMTSPPSLGTYLMDYQKLLKDRHGDRMQQLIGQFGEGIATACELSCAVMEDHCSETLRLLRIIICMGTDDIFYDLFAPLLGADSEGASISGGDTAELDGDTRAKIDFIKYIVDVLRRFSFLSKAEDEDSFSMPKPVHSWAYARMSNDEKAQHTYNSLEFMDKLLVWRRYEPNTMQRLVPHVLACLDKLKQWPQRPGSELHQTALSYSATLSEFLAHAGHLPEAFSACELRCSAWKTISETSGGNRLIDPLLPILATNDLAQMHIRHHRWSPAHSLLESVISSLTSLALPRTHVDFLRALSDLALTHLQLGNLSAAEELNLELLSLRRELFGEEDEGTLLSLHNLAVTYRRQGKHAEAEETHKAVIGVRERTLGREHAHTLMGMHNLAYTYWFGKKLEEAEGLGREVLGLRERTLGREHPHTLATVHDLGVTLYELGKLEEAEGLMGWAVEGNSKIRGEGDRITRLSAGWLGRIRREMGEGKREMGSDGGATETTRE